MRRLHAQLFDATPPDPLHVSPFAQSSWTPFHLGRVRQTAFLAAGFALLGFAALPAHADVNLSVGVRIDAQTYGASISANAVNASIVHGRAFAGSVSSGAAIVGAGANPNCTGGCTTTAKVRADAEFDTALGVFRAAGGGGTTSNSGESDIGGSAEFVLDDVITPSGGPLFFDLHLNWAFAGYAVGPISAVSGGLMQYVIEIEPLTCNHPDGCKESLFSFEALGSSFGGAGWTYSCPSYCLNGGGLGSGNAGTINVSLALPNSVDPFKLRVTGMLRADCGIYIPDGQASCDTQANAYQSAYIGINGAFSSANGYGYQGFAAAVPEPGTSAMLTAGGLVLAGWLRRRRPTAA